MSDTIVAGDYVELMRMPGVYGTVEEVHPDYLGVGTIDVRVDRSTEALRTTSIRKGCVRAVMICHIDDVRLISPGYARLKDTE